MRRFWIRVFDRVRRLQPITGFKNSCCKAGPLLYLLAALFFLYVTPVQSANSVIVGWPANTDPGILGYNFYFGTSSRNYSTIIDVGNVTNTVVDNLLEGQTYYFAVTAYNIMGLESLPSPETAYPIPLVRFTSTPITVQPKGLLSINIAGPVGRSAVLLASTNLTTWSPISTNVFTTTNLFIKVTDSPGVTKTRFFRVKLL
jgi:hypothetical protein